MVFTSPMPMEDSSVGYHYHTSSRAIYRATYIFLACNLYQYMQSLTVMLNYIVAVPLLFFVL